MFFCITTADISTWHARIIVGLFLTQSIGLFLTLYISFYYFWQICFIFVIHYARNDAYDLALLVENHIRSKKQIKLTLLQKQTLGSRDVKKAENWNLAELVMELFPNIMKNWECWMRESWHNGNIILLTVIKFMFQGHLHVYQ